MRRGAIVNGISLYQIRFLMKSEDTAEIQQLLGELREEHRDLDQAIKRMSTEPWQDQLRMRRMKKRKLKLKDWILRLESKMIPDLDA